MLEGAQALLHCGQAVPDVLPQPEPGRPGIAVAPVVQRPFGELEHGGKLLGREEGHRGGLRCS